MKPKPWSYTGLSDFINCPRAFHEKRILKTFPFEQTPELIWGNKVHKHFQLRQRDGTALPEELEAHEPFMQLLTSLPGVARTEDKVALNTKAQVCPYFAKDVWVRGILDWHKKDRSYVRIVDYKTGKVKDDHKQLTLFALQTFIRYPDVTEISAGYYWTQTSELKNAKFTRDDMIEMWGLFTPDLQQYVEAFQEEIWQPRQSGLCYGWCPVTTCEFWKPKKR